MKALWVVAPRLRSQIRSLKWGKKSYIDVNSKGLQILISPLALVLFGLVWSLVVPHTPFPRLALTAHIQFVMNGMLFVLMALLLLALPNNVGPRSASVMVLAVWLTWLIALSEVANAWWAPRNYCPSPRNRPAQQAASCGRKRCETDAYWCRLGVIVARSLLIAGFRKSPKHWLLFDSA
jgi:hydroxylaminobenzene mutase